MSNEHAVKPKSKKLEVPVHTCAVGSKGHDETNKNNYGANFHSNRYKHRNESKPKTKPDTTKEPHELDSHRFGRKYLAKENVRLCKENEDIVIKFNELEELSLKKISKLKDKIRTLVTTNEELGKENIDLKNELKFQLDITSHCKNCEGYQVLIEKYTNENVSLLNSKQRLEDDLSMLKTVVYRLNVQLERYQQKLLKLNVETNNTKSSPKNEVSRNFPIIDNCDPHVLDLHRDHSHTPISWGGVNVHTLGPLLDAYQCTIDEKDEIIATYETEIGHFTGRLKEIVDENERLQKYISYDSQCSAELKAEVAKVRHELSELKKQNDILIKKCATKQEKLEEVIDCYEHKLQQLKRDYSTLHEEYCKRHKELITVKEKNKALVESQDDFKNERQNYISLSLHSNSITECKKLYEELKLQYEQEKKKLQQNLEQQNDLITDLRKTLDDHVKQRECLNSTIKQLEKQLKKSEAKHLELECNLSRTQLAKNSCKKQLHKAMSFAKDLVNEQESLLQILNVKHKENVTVRKIGLDIATKMDVLRSQLKDVQRDAWRELTSVEKRIEDQHQSIEHLKQEHNEELGRLQKIIQEQQPVSLLKEQLQVSGSHYTLFRNKHN